MTKTDRPDARLPPDPTLDATIAQVDRCVDAVHFSAMAIGRVALLDAYDVPRLCVSAGLRTLEKQIEHYERRLAAAEQGGQPFEITEKARMRQQILASANDLQDVMAEALGTVNNIREALGVKPN